MTLDHALAAAKRGWSVFPVKGKVPTVRWADEATCDPHTIVAWLAGTDLNYGIACGPSGLLVIDEDTPGDLEKYAAHVGHTIPDTFTVTTGRGSHFYFNANGHDLGNAEHALKTYGVNVRGRGGYVVGPGSTHANGTEYRVTDNMPAAPLPSWLVDALTPSPQITTPGDPLGPRGLDAVPEVIPEGQRHPTMFAYASSLRARNIPTREAETLFRGAWQRCQQPPDTPTAYTWREALATLQDCYTRYPPGSSYTGVPVEADPEAAMEYAAEFARRVAEERYRLKVRDAAREQVQAEKAAATEVPSFDADLLGHILTRPADPPHRVTGLIPTDAATLVVAQRKTGKTTLLLNLARALLTGEPFLARFHVRPVTGRVALLNFEVSAAQVARWADDAQVPPDRLFVVNLRGRRNPLQHPADREQLAGLLRHQEAETVMVDPFGRAYTGQSQNDPGEVGAWLADLDRFARGDCGASDVILAAHAGWNGERTRGASALEDWADSIITLTRDNADPSRRFLRAEGRDVEVEEDQLHFDPVSRRLSLTGHGSRKQAEESRHLNELVTALAEVVTNDPGLGIAEITTRLRARKDLSFRDRDVSKASKQAEEQGLIRRDSHPRVRGRRPSTIPPPRPTPSSPRPRTRYPTPRPPRLIGTGWGVGVVPAPRPSRTGSATRPPNCRSSCRTLSRSSRRISREAHRQHHPH